MKNVFKVVLFMGALALSMGILVNQLLPARANVNATVEFRTAVGTTAAVVSVASTDPAAINQIAVMVTDADVTTDEYVTTTIKSTSDSTGITIALAVLDASEGIFASVIELSATSSSATATPPRLRAAHDDTITATYTDNTPTFGTSLGREGTLDVDSKGPVLSALVPVDGTITNDSSFTMSVEAQDGDSAVDASSILFLINTSADATSSAATSTPDSTSDITDADDDVIGSSGKLSVVFQGEIFLTAQAKDDAGNLTILDVDKDDDTKTMARIIIDTTMATVDAVFTGVGYDAKDQVLEVDKRNKLIVLFKENLSKLEADTVTADDFQITDPDRTVSAADVFDSAVVSTTKVADLGDANSNMEVGLAVFLTLDSDLGPGDTPKVKIIGDGVDNEAGVTNDSDDKTAKDRITPSITVSGLTPALAAKDAKVTFTVTADEELEGSPTIVITNLETGGTVGKSLDETETDKVWEVTTNKVSTAGTYSIYITGDDGEANRGDVGEATTTAKAAVDSDDIVEFEVDIALEPPLIEPSDDDEVTTRDPFFITIDFTSSTGATAEGDEYEGDSSTDITITKATLDGDDVLADVSTDDDQVFLLAVNGITSEEHTLLINAKDEAGNTLDDDVSITFEVKDRSDFGLKLRPGWNLISLPSDPGDMDINAVFSDLPGVSDVVTYDPRVPGGTLSAVRDETGSFVGTLETISASRGYWVNSDKFKTLEVALTRLAAGQVSVLPPSIPIVKGWNLIPVVDITGLLDAGDQVAGGSYLASVVGDISRVYHFDTLKNQWVNVPDFASTDDPGGAGGKLNQLAVGKGYFVYATDTGVLVP